VKITANITEERGIHICRVQVRERIKGKTVTSTRAAAHPEIRGAWAACADFVRSLTPRSTKKSWPGGSQPLEGARRRGGR
jgi:hypothetical protein